METVNDPFHSAFTDLAPAALVWSCAEYQDRMELVMAAGFTATQQLEVMRKLWWEIPVGLRLKLVDAMSKWAVEMERHQRDNGKYPGVRRAES